MICILGVHAGVCSVGASSLLGKDAVDPESLGQLSRPPSPNKVTDWAWPASDASQQKARLSPNMI